MDCTSETPSTRAERSRLWQFMFFKLSLVVYHHLSCCWPLWCKLSLVVPVSSSLSLCHTMPLDKSATALLGGDSEFVTPIKGARDPETGEKRTKLRRYEHTAAQVLNVSGVSPIHECSNCALWSTSMNGIKKVGFQ